jgi:hypothetical protein
MQTATIFNHETVALDGERFSDCEFRACRMVYSGGTPPHFDNCRIDDCEWKFEGPAADTLEHLQVMWGAGAKATVQGLIKTITGAR